jgi:tetratricopeptide (TPR) repeat protein
MPGAIQPHDPANLLEQARDLAEKKQLVEAERACRDAAKSSNQRLVDHPDDAAGILAYRCQGRLGDLLTNLHKFPEARVVLKKNIAALRRLVAAHRDNPEPRFALARALRAQADCLTESELTVEAAKSMQEAVVLLSQLAGQDHAKVEYRRELVDALERHGCVTMHLAKQAEAESAFKRAVHFARELLADSRQAPEDVERLAVALNGHALLLRDSGQVAEAATIVREAITLLKKLQADDPDEPRYWFRLPSLYRNLAQACASLLNGPEEAVARAESQRLELKLAAMPGAVLTLLADEQLILARLGSADVRQLLDGQALVETIFTNAQELAKNHPDVPLYRGRVMACQIVRGIRFFAEGKATEAEHSLAEVVDVVEKLAAEAPDLPRYRRQLAHVWCLRGMGQALSGNLAAGKESWRTCWRLYEKLVADFPQDPHFACAWANALIMVQTFRAGLKDQRGALENLTAALAIQKKLAQEYPTYPDFRRNYAQTLISLAVQRGACLDNDGAEDTFREAIRIWAQVVADFPDSVDSRMALGNAHFSLSRFLECIGKPAGIEEELRQALHVHYALARDFPKDAELQATVGADHGFLGKLHEDQKQFSAALQDYTRTLACYEVAWKLSPRHRDYLITIRGTCQRRAFLLLKLDDHAGYEQDLHRAEELGELLEPAVVRLHRIGQRLQEGKLDAALCDADDLFLGDDLASSEWRDLAGAYARAAAAISEPAWKESLSRHAVEALRKALEGDYRSPHPLDDDADFRCLCGREDFGKLAGACR